MSTSHSNVNYHSRTMATNSISFNTLIFTAVSVILASVTLLSPFTSLRNLLYNGEDLRELDNHYVIYFDGGSTGTRIHVFKFLNHSGGQIDLISEKYHHTQPGLSSYASNPENAAESLVPLLEKAEAVIPKSKWTDTPIVLKATAGLRLLPEKSASEILNAVQNYFALSPFKFVANCVSVLDDTDEGLYAWQTVNFMLGRMNYMKDTVATLDLGGGSTQVTFYPEDLQTLMLSPPDHILDRPYSKGEKPLAIYTKSYLGFGLMSARLGTILTSSSHHQTVTDNGLIVLETPCFYPESSREWKYNGTNYLIRGLNTSAFGYHTCHHQVNAFLSGHIFSPPEIEEQDIYALSYYYDRAIDAGIIDRKPYARITVADFRQAAKRVCSKLNDKRLFLCLDLTYITSLLHDGLGLDYSKDIHLTKKIEGVEASWVLGAAFQYLS